MRTLLALTVGLLLCQSALAQRLIVKDATDQSVYVKIIDSATGVPETGVTSATTGLDLEYVRNGAAAANIAASLSDLAAADSAHSDGGIFHVGHGIYRVDVADAAFATGVDSVVVCGTATDMIVLECDVQLIVADLQAALITAAGIEAECDDAITANTKILAIEADTNELQTDLTDGGRLDLIFDATLADTNELQGDWANGGRLDLIVDAILADTNEMQGDLANGGRLDLLFDATLKADVAYDVTTTNGVLSTTFATP